MEGIYLRSELLLGEQAVQKLHETKVIIFGLGGVGSWCVESFVRTGITNITLVDCDKVCITNINRQLMATTKTIGQEKAIALKNRLLDINPNANITACHKVYSLQNWQEFDLTQYDVIIDAIDSPYSKAKLILEASNTDAIFISSMGAALKIDPTKVQTGSFWEVKGCPMARRIRKLVRKMGKPARTFPVVYSEEVLENKGSNTACTSAHCTCSDHNSDKKKEDLISKKIINGSLAHVTGIFGLTIAGLAIQEICSRINEE